jgi:hypothetical protein
LLADIDDAAAADINHAVAIADAADIILLVVMLISMLPLLLVLVLVLLLVLLISMLLLLLIWTPL